MLHGSSAGVNASVLLTIGDIPARTLILPGGPSPAVITEMLPIVRYALVGRRTQDTLLNKNLLDPSNQIATNILRAGASFVTIGDVPPSPGQFLSAISATSAAWVGIPAPTRGTFIDNQTFIVSSINATRRLGFAIGGANNATTTITTAPTQARTFIIPNISGTAVMSQTGTEQIFMGGPIASLHGSESGMQYSSSVVSRPQLRLNMYGDHRGAPGVVGFKSRGGDLGSLGGVLVGDTLFRAAAIGVSMDGGMPTAGTIGIQVSTSEGDFIGAKFVLQLSSDMGPSKSLRSVFEIDSHGGMHLMEMTSKNPQKEPITPPSGIVQLDRGSAVVRHIHLPENARIMLTVQPGPEPLGLIWCSEIKPGDHREEGSFTISSTNRDDRCIVYYLIMIPMP